jgi:TAT (twin-arginine translocation) pathway signal sequence.
MRQPAPTATPTVADQPQAGRRNLLKALGAAPLLPLAGGLSASALLAACATPGAGKPFASARFTGMPARPWTTRPPWPPPPSARPWK